MSRGWSKVAFIALVVLVGAFLTRVVLLDAQVRDARDAIGHNVRLLIQLDSGGAVTDLDAALEDAGLTEEERRSRVAALTALRAKNSRISLELGEAWQSARTLSVAALAFGLGTVFLAVLWMRALRQRNRLELALAENAENAEISVRQRAVLRQLEVSNARLERFAVALSHDLKAPLRALITYAELAQQVEGPDQEGYQEKALQQARRMRDMVEGLLAVSRAGTRDAAELIDLADLLETAFAPVADAYADAGARIEVGSLPQVRGSRVELANVFQNLFENALAYRSADRALVVAIEQIPGREVHVVVRDNGRGIRPDQAEAVFGLFRRGLDVEDTQGTGVGLALCRATIERMEGSIWMEPGEPGVAVHLTFPEA